MKSLPLGEVTALAAALATAAAAANHLRVSGCSCITRNILRPAAAAEKAPGAS